MYKTLYILPILFVLVGCGEKVVTQGKEKESIKEVVSVVPEEAKEMKDVVTSENKNTLVTYEVPELGIAFDTEKQYGDDLVYKYNDEHDFVTFNSQNLIDRYQCPAGQLGGLSRHAVDYECIGSAEVYLSEKYKYCFGGPQALCTDSVSKDNAEDIASFDIKTIREL